MGIGKKILLVIGIILLVVIIVGVGIYFSITSSNIISAQIHIESGKVLVNGNELVGDSTLKEGDIIETKEDGKATVILYESVIINLDSNTKVTLDSLVKENPKISQEGGETWNKFTKLSGVQEYSVSSGNSVASVRGTAFAFKKGKLMTGEGEVDFEIDGKKYKVGKNKVVEKLEDKINEREASQDEISEMGKKEERTIKMLKILRQKEIEKHPKVVGIIKSKFNLDDEGLKNKLEEADEGKFDLEEVAKLSPIKISSIDKVVEITKKIIEIKQAQKK